MSPKKGVVISQEKIVHDLVDSMVSEMERQFPERPLLTVDDLAKFFGCHREVIYNWNRRNDVKRRPPKVSFGKEVRYQKRAVALWMAIEQLGGEMS